MNKTIAIGAIILIIISAGYFIWKEKPNKSDEVKVESNANISGNVSVNPEDQSQIGQKENIVVYTDAGFSPNKFEIAVNSVVVFKNESSVLMWVASAPHPMHTNYSEFDAKKEYEKGSSYSFTFDKTGEFKYHNHLNPSRFGAITVK